MTAIFTGGTLATTIAQLGVEPEMLLRAAIGGKVLSPGATRGRRGWVLGQLDCLEQRPGQVPLVAVEEAADRVPVDHLGDRIPVRAHHRRATRERLGEHDSERVPG